ncbi:MAG: hypothetical protein KAT54_07055 [Candidatus Marinimicrobia bacterium]|nr:hypothetical protein [Candidatus Neomarinimicrobiota bacterium]
MCRNLSRFIRIGSDGATALGEVGSVVDCSSTNIISDTENGYVQTDNFEI